MKVLISDGLSEAGQKILIDAGFDVVNHKYPAEELPGAIADFDAIMVRSATKVTREVIDAGSSLKVIARGGVGLDNIDVEYAKSKGIAVLNTPAASAISVAELAIGHMLALSRNLHLSTTAMREGKWPKKEYSKGFELFQKTLGVIGLGSIGKEVARRGIGLGMNVIAFDPLYSPMNFFIEITSAEEVYKRADIITLHVPFIKSVGPLLTKREFDMMKNGVVIINCARGGVVKEVDLLEALNSGKVQAAGIDVFENEPPTEAQNELINHPNVSVSPHIGGSTIEAQDRIGIEIAQKVVETLRAHAS